MRDYKFHYIDIRINNYNLETILDREESPHVGLENYKAPEVIMKVENLTEKVDIWAAGVLAFWLYSGGHMPFTPNYENDTHG